VDLEVKYLYAIIADRDVLEYRRGRFVSVQSQPCVVEDRSNIATIQGSRQESVIATDD
jgi:hypothetical protein